MEQHDYRCSFKVHYGGEFVTRKFKTEYFSKGKDVGVLIKDNLSEVCYFNLIDIVKSELKIEDGEIWYNRQGYSLFAGRKKLVDDKDIEELMGSKDENGFVNLFVVQGKGKKDGTQANITSSLSENFRPTASITVINKPLIKHTTTSVTKSNTSQKTQPYTTPSISKASKIPFRRTRQSKKKTTSVEQSDAIKEVHIECGEDNKEDNGDRLEEEDGGDSGEDSEDPDVVLSDGDFDDEDDDDIFSQFVDEDILATPRISSSLEIIVHEAENDDVEVETEDDLVSDEDELETSHGSDEEQLDDNCQYPTFNPETDFQKSVVLELGLKFPSKEVFRKALRYHAIEHGYDYYFMHNGSKRICVQCRHRCDCPWLTGQGKFGACKCNSPKKCRFLVNAVKIANEETFQIMSLRLKHNCGWSDFNSKLSSEYLAERYLDYWRIDNEWKIDKFQQRVMLDIGVEIGYYKAYYARARALKMLHGEASEEYKRVWEYSTMVTKFDVGSSVYVKVTNIERPPPIFQRMYMCFKACKLGFINGCRPILGVDGCHLKGEYPGQLLTAVGKDGNCNIFPVAWAVVEVENTDTWSWFLELLSNDLQPISDNITFMSDRQKGLIEAFKRVVPNCEVRFCARHIWTNFKAKYPGTAFKQLFWQTVRAYTQVECEQHLESIKKLSVQAHSYLTSIPPAHWCRYAFSPNCTSGMLLNNCCESFNNVLRKCRDKPILSLMEWIRRYNMKRLFAKREGVDKYDGDFMPAAMKQLSIAAKISKQCKPFQCHSNKFEVEHHEERYVVDLEKKTCNCKKWELTGIPCAHAISAIDKKRLVPKSFLHQAYSKETYMKAYGNYISPLPGPKQWEKTPHPEPVPPPFRKMPGRPSSKKRRKEAGEIEERRIVKKRNTQKKVY